MTSYNSSSSSTTAPHPEFEASASPSTSPPAPSSPTYLSTDLRHMTSNSGLASPGRDSTKAANRLSQHLQTGVGRLGSKSPSSIPSSPTSIHSSSSAIFERDIEPLPSSVLGSHFLSTSPHSPPSIHHQTNPHRIPRSKATESIDQSVPTVLDSAAAALASTSVDEVAIVAPAQSTSGWASPISSLKGRSRSPSPMSSRDRSPIDGSFRRSSGVASPSLLLGIPSGSPPSTAVGSISPGSSPRERSGTIQPAVRPMVQTTDISDTKKSITQTPPALVTPTSAYFSASSSTASSSPQTTTREVHPVHSLPASPPAQQTATAQSPSLSSHPPSPNAAISKRLSFMSYNDLLNSTPASLVPLSSLTSAAPTEPPPHIPSVTGFSSASGSGTIRSGGSAAGSLVGGGRDSIMLLDDMGGEWEREGLGRGLEERLEALMGSSPAPTSVAHA